MNGLATATATDWVVHNSMTSRISPGRGFRVLEARAIRGFGVNDHINASAEPTAPWLAEGVSAGQVANQRRADISRQTLGEEAIQGGTTGPHDSQRRGPDPHRRMRRQGPSPRQCYRRWTSIVSFGIPPRLCHLGEAFLGSLTAAHRARAGRRRCSRETLPSAKWPPQAGCIEPASQAQPAPV